MTANRDDTVTKCTNPLLARKEREEAHMIVCAADIIAFSPHHSNIWGFPGGAVVKNPHALAADSRDKSLIPGLGRSPGVESGNPLQYSRLENSSTDGPGSLQFMGVTKSRTRLIVHRHTHSNTYRVDFIIPILEVKSLRAWEVRFLSQDLTSTKSQRPTSGLPAGRTPPFSTVMLRSFIPETWEPNLTSCDLSKALRPHIWL